MPTLDLVVSRARRSLRMAGLALSLASTLVAGMPRAASAQLVPADTQQTLFTARDAWIAGGFAALTVAMFPLDRRLAHALRDSSLLTNRVLSDASKLVEGITDPGALAIGATLYTVGRVGKWRDVADLGWHGTEAVILSGVATSILKGTLGRARPYTSADTNPRDFAFGRGFGDNKYQSFPSGHATAAFAAAAAVTSESRRWWPHATWAVATTMYGGATLVALSRIYHDKHWASDVVMGAAVGTFGGLKVVRYSHNHPDNFVDRVVLPMQAMVAPDGRLGLGWSRSF